MTSGFLALPHILLLFFFGMLGACMGSFFAVIIYRLPLGLSIIDLESFCFNCKKSISWRLKVPIFSYIYLCGHCHDCKMPIGFRNWFLECFFSLLAVILFWKFGFSFVFLEKYLFVGLLVSIAYIDLDTFYIPNLLIFWLIILGIFSSLFFFYFPENYITNHHYQSLFKLFLVNEQFSFSVFDRMLGAFFGFLFFYSLNLFFTYLFRKSKRLEQDQWAMGFGDSLLIMSIGLFVGFSHLILVIFLASFFGSIYGLFSALKIAKPRNDVPKGAIPFGPFLSIAAIFVYLL